MEFQYTKTISDNFTPDAIIFFSFKDEELLRKKLNAIQKELGISLDSNAMNDFKGKDTQVSVYYVNGKRIILSGLGKKEKYNLEVLRNSTARAAKYAESIKLSNIAVEIFKASGKVEDVISAETEAIILGLYKFNKYKKDKKEENGDNKKEIKSVILFGDAGQPNKINKVIFDAQAIAEATAFTRDLGNEPSNFMFPEEFAKIVSAEGKTGNFEVKIFNKTELTKMKMGGILGVAQGSMREPRLAVLKYNGGRAKDKPIVIVGKGVTFDTGGISIKPSPNMENMKMDMNGGAAVAGIFKALGQLKLKVNVIGLIPMVENMPSGTAFKPGDILTSYNGMTIEVQNTDAEGRLILADALAYADQFQPKYIIDMATLTGAALIALGNTATIAVTNDDSLYKKLERAGKETHERLWQLPSWDDYDKLIDSDVADVCNIGAGRVAGSIVAGMFLKRFVNNNNWCHLDIAGTGMAPKQMSEYVPKYSTGVGVRLLTRFLMDEANSR
jgi:leucyl aminopeptidase